MRATEKPTSAIVWPTSETEKPTSAIVWPTSATAKLRPLNVK
jgi:hypothetical protein